MLVLHRLDTQVSQQHAGSCKMSLALLVEQIDQIDQMDKVLGRPTENARKKYSDFLIF
jgi:hypothetical protein